MHASHTWQTYIMIRRGGMCVRRTHGKGIKKSSLTYKLQSTSLIHIKCSLRRELDEAVSGIKSPTGNLIAVPDQLGDVRPDDDLLIPEALFHGQVLQSAIAIPYLLSVKERQVLFER